MGFLPFLPVKIRSLTVLCNRKIFTVEDVLAAVWDSGDDSGSGSEFSDENSEIDCNEKINWIFRIYKNEAYYKGKLLIFDVSR